MPLERALALLDVVMLLCRGSGGDAFDVCREGSASTRDGGEAASFS